MGRTFYQYGDPAFSAPYIFLGSNADTSDLYMAVWTGVDFFFTDSYIPIPDNYFYWTIRYTDSTHTMDLALATSPDPDTLPTIFDTFAVDLSAVTFTIDTEMVGNGWSDFRFGYIGIFQSSLTLAQIHSQSLIKTPLVAALSFTPLANKDDVDDITVNGHDWIVSGSLLTAFGPFPATSVGPYTTSRLFTAPSAANSVSVTPNSSAWTNSAWFEIEASTDAAWILTGLIVTPDNHSAGDNYEVDVGVGAAASEVVVTTFSGSFLSKSADSPGVLQSTIPLDNIGVGVRVSVRLRKSGTTTFVWAVSAQFYKKPITGSFLTTAKPQKVYPEAATQTALTTGASIWGSSTYTQLVASTSADYVLVGVVVDTFSGNSGWEFDLSVGPALSEVVIATVRAYHTGIQFTDGPNFVPLSRPSDTIPSGSRISARTRSQIIIGSRQAFIGFVYIEKPL